MNHHIKSSLSLHWEGVRNSYAQVFFSNSKWFAILLFLATFTDPYAGLSGLLAVAITHIVADWIGLSEAYIRRGVYGYNSMMTGLVLGVYFKLSLPFFLILFLASILCLIFTAWMAIILDKYKVPFLSVPFLFTIWIILLATRNYHALELSERGIYTINELYNYGGEFLLELNNTINSLSIPLFLSVYFKSLGAIIFQYNIIAGFLISIGLLIYSRIAFSLSLIGFTTGFLFYQTLEANFSELIYSYIGFNFILLAISIGGFFLVPSFRSYLLIIIATPLAAIMISAFSYFFYYLQLPMYSLSFNIIGILFLFILNFRSVFKKPELVTQQLFSPEKNLYIHKNRLERFKQQTYFHIALPFYGRWKVSQGYEGKITHKDEWKYALDFVVTDEENNTYKSPGTSVADYYCYNLPVLAPLGGWVTEIKDGVEDNAIGEVDLNNNWGNTIIIKHSDILYSKLSHIKKGSFKVKLGDYVSQGDMVGYCGSSGRSPEPHLHFQMQATPYIGSKTLYYPIGYYISYSNGKHFFNSFSVPKEEEQVSRVEINSLMKNAFNFIPGKILLFKVDRNNKIEEVKWEVFTDAYNQTHIYCHNSGSTAYLINNNVLHYFTDFYGDKNSLLYYFYLGAHKVLLGYYQDLELEDILPLSTVRIGLLKYLQDFIAPFNQYLKINYHSKFKSTDDLYYPKEIIFESSVKAILGKKTIKDLKFQIEIKEDKIFSIHIIHKSNEWRAICID